MSTYRFLRTIEPEWSVGDRLTMQLELPDEPAVRRSLAPLGLEVVADMKIGDGSAEVLGELLQFQVFGTTTTLTLGPEDRYDFLEPRHHEQASRLEAMIMTHGLESAVVHTPFELREARLERLRGTPTQRRAEQYNRRRTPAHTEYTVRVERPIGGARWTTRTLRPTRTSWQVDALEINEETTCFAATTGEHVGLDTLKPGTVATATLSVGRRSDGAFGPVASRLDLFIPPEPLMARVRRWAEPLRRLGVTLEPPDLATFAAMHMVDRHAGRDVPVEHDLIAELLYARHARPMPGGSPDDAVESLLESLRDLRLPCLFNPRAVLDEARNRPAGDALESRLIEEGNRSAASVGDLRRWTHVRLLGRDTADRFLLTEDERRFLAERGLGA